MKTQKTTCIWFILFFLFCGISLQAQKKFGNFFDGLAYCYAQFNYVDYSGFINKKGEYVLIFQKEEL